MRPFLASITKVSHRHKNLLFVGELNERRLDSKMLKKFRNCFSFLKKKVFRCIEMKLYDEKKVLVESLETLISFIPNFTSIFSWLLKLE